MADDVVPSGVRDLITADERHLVDQIIDCVSWLESGKAHAREYATRLLAALQQARQECARLETTNSEIAHEHDVEYSRAESLQAQLVAQDAAIQGLEAKKFPLPMHGHSTCAADPEVVKWADVLDVLASVRAARREG